MCVPCTLTLGDRTREQSSALASLALPHSPPSFSFPHPLSLHSNTTIPTMSIYTKPKNSDLQLSLYLSQALSYLSDHASMTLFSVRKLNVGSSQKVFNPDGSPIADNVQLTMRSSSIGSNSVDCKTYFLFFSCNNTSALDSSSTVAIHSSRTRARVAHCNMWHFSPSLFSFVAFSLTAAQVTFAFHIFPSFVSHQYSCSMIHTTGPSLQTLSSMVSS